MWTLYGQATAFSRRPSEIVGIEDEWAAYQFDSACLYLGRWIDNKLGERNPRTGRPLYSLEGLLADGNSPPPPGGFKNPTGLVTRKVRANADGTW